MGDWTARSIVADHIRGLRKALRRNRQQLLEERERVGTSFEIGGLRWLEGLIYGQECELRDLRDVAAVLRGKA